MQPLNSIKRKISLLILLLVFLVISPFIILNSFGYKIGDSFSFVKTGGIYIHSDISNTEIFVNGKFIKNGGVLIRNTLIPKLKPNLNYKVEIHKDGFRSWIKEIYVYPSLVSEGRVLMLPNEIEANPVLAFVDEAGVATNTPATTTPKTKSGLFIPDNERFIEIETLFEGENPYITVVEDQALIKSKNELATSTTPLEIPEHFIELGIEDPDSLENLIETSSEVSWLENGNIQLYWIKNLSSIPYYYCDRDLERGCDIEIDLDWENDIEKFAYFPGRDDVWVVLVKNQLYAVEVDPRSQRNIQLIYEGADLDFVKDDSGNIVVKDGGAFFELEL